MILNFFVNCFLSSKNTNSGFTTIFRKALVYLVENWDVWENFEKSYWLFV